MNTDKYSIVNIIKDLENKKLVLPAIQRAFVWKPEQIEKLFDSMMQDFPIGTILLWHLDNPQEIENMKFYTCPYNYTKGQAPEFAPNPCKKEEVYAVLDGQQRLTSIYIATQGSYNESPDSKHKDKHKELYIDLLYSPKEDSDTKYKFKFLTEKKANNDTDKNSYWYNIKNAMKLKNPREVNSIVNDIQKKLPSLSDEIQDRISNTLDILRKLLTQTDKYILITDTIESDKKQEDVLEIFVRVNHQGTKLTKTDLLLSSMIDEWEDVREEFYDLTQSVKKNNLEFDQDLIMKTALACIGKTVVFKLQTFNRETVQQIKEAWPNIEQALISTSELFKKLGFCDDNILAYNVTIPVAYYLYYHPNPSAETEKEIKQFVAISLLKKIFGGHSDQTINDMIKILKETASFTALMNYKDFAKKFQCDDVDLEDWLDEKKGPYAYLLLSIIYDKLDYSKATFDLDHIHPFSKFTIKNLKDENIDPQKLNKWKEDRDKLPNLQLLTAKENRKEKHTKSLLQWLTAIGESEDTFKTNNYINKEISLKLENFDEFYSDRKKNLRNELIEKLKIK